MIRICVADDEKLHIDRLRLFLNRFFPSQKEYTLTVFTNGEDLVRSYAPVYDIIFLDIEMPRLNGMDTARQIRRQDSDVVIIFLTRMAQYAVRGYEVNAFDFIVKPVDYPSFSAKLKRAMTVAAQKQEYKIEIRPDGGAMWLPTSSVYYIEVIQHNLTYHTSLGTFSERRSLSELEETLREYGFRYCSRYCLVNLKFVQGIYDQYVIVCGEKLEISRRRRKALMETMIDYYEGKSHV